MILLITPSSRGQECAQVLFASTNHPTDVASTLQAAVSKLRQDEYAAVVIDQFVLEVEPEGEQMLRHLGSAFPVYVNCAISGVERIVREVQSALRRRQREEQIARSSASHLSCDLALASKEVPQYAADRICMIHDLATQMRARFISSEQN
jgi:hypothetical protein